MNELTSGENLRAALAEFLATFIFVFVGVGAIGASLEILGQPQTLFYIAAAHGIGIGLGVAAMGRISGGHMNPAVTISAMLSGRMGAIRSAMYIVAQLVGAILAVLALKTLAFDRADNLGVQALGSRLNSGEGFVVEVIITFILVFTIFAVAMDKRSNKVLAPFAIGLAYAVCTMVAIQLTGASMNPARSFGPALVFGSWADHWIYWAGPLVGGLIAAVAYTFFFGEKEDLDKLGSLSR